VRSQHPNTNEPHSHLKPSINHTNGSRSHRHCMWLFPNNSQHSLHHLVAPATSAKHDSSRETTSLQKKVLYGPFPLNRSQQDDQCSISRPMVTASHGIWHQETLFNAKLSPPRPQQRGSSNFAGGKLKFNRHENWLNACTESVLGTD
jgi:hypothetical protein